MRETVGPDMGVKASGGVHNAEEALAMIEAGQHASVQVRVQQLFLAQLAKGINSYFKLNEGVAKKMTVKQEWLDCAVEALAHAYVPYSNFPVGACLVTADGKCIKESTLKMPPLV